MMTPLQLDSQQISTSPHFGLRVSGPHSLGSDDLVIEPTLHGIQRGMDF